MPENPDSGSNNSPPENPPETILREGARRSLDDKDYDSVLALVRKLWESQAPDLSSCLLLSQALTGRGNKNLGRLVEKVGRCREGWDGDPRLLFETGYGFIDAREPELATLFLSRCHAIAPGNLDGVYELGFALMQSRRFAEALPHFKRLAENQLAEHQNEDDFDILLNLLVCYTMTLDLPRAESVLKGLEKRTDLADEERKELLNRSSVLRRLEKLKGKSELSARDWSYSLYGTILLADAKNQDSSSTAAAPSSSSGSGSSDYTGLSSSLVVLRGLLSEMDWEFDIIEYYNPMSRPLAEALARLMDLSAESYGGPERKERSLLVLASAADIVGPHKSFVDQSEGSRSIFAANITRRQSLPITPELIGTLSGVQAMPWGKEMDEYDEPDEKSAVHPMNKIQGQATDRLLSRASDLESAPETINRIEELARYYRSKRDLLLMRNGDRFPERPEYTAEILS